MGEWGRKKYIICLTCYLFCYLVAFNKSILYSSLWLDLPVSLEGSGSLLGISAISAVVFFRWVADLSFDSKNDHTLLITGILYLFYKDSSEIKLNWVLLTSCQLCGNFSAKFSLCDNFFSIWNMVHSPRKFADPHLQMGVPLKFFHPQHAPIRTLFFTFFTYGS